MDTKMKDGGPAFPWNELNQQTGGVYAQFSGMSLRDYFAGQALASGLCPHNVHDHVRVASWCLDQADAMLAARSGDK